MSKTTYSHFFSKLQLRCQIAEIITHIKRGILKRAVIMINCGPYIGNNLFPKEAIFFPLSADSGNTSNVKSF